LPEQEAPHRGAFVFHGRILAPAGASLALARK